LELLLLALCTKEIDGNFYLSVCGWGTRCQFFPLLKVREGEQLLIADGRDPPWLTGKDELSSDEAQPIREIWREDYHCFRVLYLCLQLFHAMVPRSIGVAIGQD
jgi:hypothetical protein